MHIHTGLASHFHKTNTRLSHCLEISICSRPEHLLDMAQQFCPLNTVPQGLCQTSPLTSHIYQV